MCIRMLKGYLYPIAVHAVEHGGVGYLASWFSAFIGWLDHTAQKTRVMSVRCLGNDD